MLKTIIAILCLSVFTLGGISSSGDISKLNSCEVLSNDYLAKVLDWSASAIKKDETRFKRASVCTINHDEENMLVRLGWSSSAAKKNRVPERQFAKFLKDGEKGMKYEEVSKNTESQVLFGKGQEKFNFITYIARKRFGNSSMIQVEVRTRSKDEEKYREKVLEMIEKIK